MAAQPFPSSERLRELYAGDYFERWGARDPAALERVRAMKHASYRDLLRTLAGLRPGGRLLDLGCAMGFLLEVAEQAGFEGWGLELNPEAVRVSRQRDSAIASRRASWTRRHFPASISTW